MSRQRPKPIPENAKTKSKTKLDMTAKFGRITHNNGHFAIQVISRSPILVPIKKLIYSFLYQDDS